MERNKLSFNLDFMKAYLNSYSPVGQEELGQSVWVDYVSNYSNVVRDTYGSAIACIEGSGESKAKVVIEAHADEISWYVNHIGDDGLIHVIRNGGSDHQIAPSKRVVIHTDKGLVEGVFGWPAIHTRKGDEVTPKVDNITIDCGCKDKKEVEELGVHVGCIVTYPDEMFVLNGKKIVGRALDNKMGGFIIAMVGEMIHKRGIELPFDLYLVNSVQEEIGLRGARMVSDLLKPQVVIVTDVCHDTSTPMISKTKEGDIKCGGGPVIGYAPAIHKTLRDNIVSVAQRENIEFQRLAMSTSTGTDTDAFAYSNGGVASALISLPLRYMHTTVEMADKKDIQDTIQLIYDTLISLKLEDILDANHTR